MTRSNIRQRLYKEPNQSKEVFIFLAIESILYTIFMLIDITSLYVGMSNVIKYCSILICFLFVLLPYRTKQKEPISINNSLDINLLRLAILFTLISDYFLLFTTNYVYGLITFIVVQSLYLIRIYSWKLKCNFINPHKASPFFYICRNLIVSSIVLILLSIILISNLPYDLKAAIGQVSKGIKEDKEIQANISLIILGAYYFVSLLLNALDAIRISKKSDTLQVRIFAIGLVLFILCDINVALFNIARFYLSSSNDILLGMSRISHDNINVIYQLSFLAMWFFYLPSQVLISLSRNGIRHN
ncbi:MAG: hypothetical protein GX323_09575 [Clostridiales bacterium]|nr:hypothetical protein [Clostridiales bacterium]